MKVYQSHEKYWDQRKYTIFGLLNTLKHSFDVLPNTNYQLFQFII